MTTGTDPVALDEILSLIHRHDWQELHRVTETWAEAEVADLFLHLSKEDRVFFYRCLPRRKAAEVFAHFDSDTQDDLIRDLSDEDTRKLLADLSPDDRTALLEELPANVTQQLFKLLSPGDLAEVRQLLGYPEESVGRIMTPDFLSIRPDMRVANAIEHIRRTGRDRETFNIIYVTDQQGVLLDVMRLRRLILADADASIESLRNDKFVALSAFDNQEYAVQVIQKYDLYALPVVDSDGVLLGIVTVDDLLDVAQEAATEDFHKSAAVAPLDIPYSQASSGLLYRKRIGWLTILIGVNLISAGVIAAYEDQLSQFIQLVFFMPLLIASGGNAGAQSATLMVRALATGDLKLSRWLRAMAKELVVGSLLGLTMGALSFALGIFRASTDIAWVVGLSMFSIVLVANLLGVVLPFLLTRFKMDPAVASSPLITSLMDAIGLLIYFGIAALIIFSNPIL
jgi:magnesium transporter